MRTISQSCTSSNLIEINGICSSSDVSSVLNDFPYWKQMYISETLLIPSQKPDIETVNTVNISSDIIYKNVITTPRSYDDTGTAPIPTPNLEGKMLTGRKLIIEGQLCQKVVYTANLVDQPVHSAHFYVPFSSYIVVPRDIIFTDVNGTQTTVDAGNVNFDVGVCIEDVSVCVLDCRRLLKQVTMMLYAKPTQSC